MNQLQVTLNKMEVALDAIADAVIFVDRDGRVQWCNAAFARLVKRSHPTIIGSTLGDLLPLMQQGKPIALKFYPDVRMRKGGYETTEYEFQQGDSTLVLEISGNCADQGDRSIVLVIRDISDRKQAEAALTETEAKFRTIIENVNDLVFSMNANGEVLYVSPNVQEITGYTAAEVKNLSFEPFTHPDDVPKCRDAIAQLVTTGQKQSGLEFRGRRKDGGWNWYSTNLALIKNTNSKLLIVGITRDITERKRAEETLRRSELKYRRLFENSQVGIFRTRLEDGLILDANQRYIELTGYSSDDEVIGKRFSTEFYVNLDDRQQLLNELYQFGEVNNWEMQFRQRDGSIHWGLYSLRLNLEEGCIEGVIAYISPRKEAEAALRRSEQKFRRLFENSQVGIFRSRISDGLILDANQRFAELIGYKNAAEVINQKYTAEFYYNPRDRLRILKELRRHRKISNFETQYRYRDGSMRWGLISTHLNLEENCLETVLTDISDRQCAEEALRQSNKLLYLINDHIPALISLVDSQQRYRFVNKQYELCFGRPATTMIGKHVRDIMGASNYQKVRGYIKAALSGERVSFENTVPFKNGQQRHMLFTLVPQIEETGVVVGYFLLGQDISERKRAEEALKASEARLNTILNSTLASIERYRFYANAEREYEYCSAGCLQVWGYSPEEMVADKNLVPSRIHPEDWAVIFAEGINAIYAERPFKFEYRYHHPDGNLRWISANLASVRDEATDSWMVTVTSIDISDRKQAEEALRASEARLNTILNSALAAISRIRVDANRQWEYEYCSSGSIQLWGYAPEELMDNKNLLLSRIVPEDLEAIQQSFDDIFAERTSKHEYRYWHPDGNLRWIAVTINSVRSKADDCWIATVIATDISDRKRAEIALAESELMFRSIVENANDALGIVNSEGVTQYVSPNIVNLTGFTAAEIEGRSFAPFLHPQDVLKVREACNRVLTTDERLSGIENRFRHKDGSWRWHSSNLSALRDTKGNVLIVTVVRDITESKRAEEALKASESRLNTILSSAVASIVHYRTYANRDWKIEYYSPGSAAIWGYSAEELMADNYLVASRIHPEDWAVMYQICFDNIFAELTFEHTYRYLHPDGNWRWISATFTSVRDEAADCWITTAICTDISDRKRAEIALAESEAKFRAIVENANAVLAIFKPEGTISYVSPNVVNLTGYTSAELANQSFEPFVHRDDLPMIVEAFNQLGATGEKLVGLEYRVRHKDGSWRWHVGNYSPSQDANGQSLIVSVGHDISDRKRAEEALKASEARLNTVLNSALAIILRMRVYANREWEIEYCSAGCIQIWGYSPEELIADKNIFLSHFVSEDLDAIYGQAFDYFFSERSFEAEYRYNHPDGSLRWLSFNTSSVRDEAADCWIVTSITTDISDRKRAEEALKASEARLNTILSSALASIQRARVYANRNWVYEYISPGSMELWGYSAEETMVDQSLVISRIHPEDWDVIYYQCIDAILTERPFQCEYRYNHPDGNLRWISVTVSSVRDEAEDCWIATVISTDISDRKRAEEALKASEARLNTILNSAVACIQRSRIYANRDWEYEYCSPGSELIYGYTAEQILADPYLISSHVHPEDWELTVPQIFENIFAERTAEHEYRYLHPDGSLRWISFTVSAVRDQAVDCWIATVIATDISDRKRAEEALKASEARLNTILDSALACIMYYRVYANQEWEVEYCSAGSRQIWGYAPEELIADKNLFVSRIVAEDLAVKAPQSFDALFAERIYEDEYRYNHPDGTLRWISVTTSSVRDEAADCWIATNICTDISDRKYLEEQLQQSQKLLDSIIENIPLSLFVKDVKNDFRYVIINKSSEKILGISKETGLGLNDYERLPKKRADYFRALDLKVIEQKTLVEIPELWYETESQENVLIRCWKIPLFDKQGNPTHLLTILEDITERWQKEQALRLIVEGTAAQTGDEFFQSCVRYLAEVLQVSHAVVTEVADEAKTKAHTLAIWADGKIGENLEYSLPGTPCGQVYQGNVCYYPQGVQKIFPDNLALVELGAESFLGMPLTDSSGNVLGHLAVIDVKPMENDPGRELILRIFAARAGAELERKKAEEALERRAQVESLISSISRQFIDQDVETAINFSLEAIAQFIGAERCCIFEYLENQTQYCLLYEWRADGIEEPSSCKKGGIGYVTPDSWFQNQMLSGRVLAISSLDEFPPEAEVARRVFQNLSIQSSLNVPMIHAGKVVGYVGADVMRFSKTWSQEDINLVTLVGELIAIGRARHKAEVALERRVQIESLISNISRQFIDQDLDTAINFTLEAIARFIGAERSSIFEYSDDQSQWGIVHGWRDRGIPALIEPATDESITTLSWFHRQILNGQVISVSSLDEFPPSAEAEKEAFKRQSIQSFVAVPMIHRGKVVGFGGVDVVSFSRTWSQEDINLLKLIGELIAIGRARHKAEQALRVAKEAAEAANRAKSTFLANMSHELRTPLNAILGFAQLMERDTAITSRQRDSLVIINRSGEHLLDLINDVLEMSKIEAGRTVLNPAPFDLHRLLETLREMFQARAEAKQLSLQFEIAPDLPQYVFTDEGKLRQILINLLSNAVKFTQTGGVTLRAKVEQGNRRLEEAIDPSPLTRHHALFFEVEDTGVGIALEEMDKLFQPFVQTMSGTQAIEGTGLGLTISRQFVRLMGGDISVNSTVGQGSTFCFNIRVTLAAFSEVAPILSSGRVLELAPNQPNYRILVVDDRRENRDLIAQLLDTVGFETRTATNGEDAIAQWQQWHPHLIWMDMRMPVMDGYEATRQIRTLEAGTARQISPDNPSPITKTIIIALTASAFEEQRANILEAGCDDFVRKPFREQAIFEKMAEHLGVRYLYAQEQESQGKREQTSRGDGKNLCSSDLAIMPAEWVAELYQAALEVDAERIFQLIEQIPATHLDLAQGLTDLVNRFCFDEILELTHPI